MRLSIICPAIKSSQNHLNRLKTVIIEYLLKEAVKINLAKATFISVYGTIKL
jgi:hypothetical protein